MSKISSTLFGTVTGLLNVLLWFYTADTTGSDLILLVGGVLATMYLLPASDKWYLMLPACTLLGVAHFVAGAVIGLAHGLPILTGCILMLLILVWIGIALRSLFFSPDDQSGGIG